MISTTTLGRMRSAVGGVAVAAAAGLALAVGGDEASAVDAPTQPDLAPPSATAPAGGPAADPAFDPDDCPACGLG